MRQDKFSASNLIVYACGLIPAVWLGLLIAPTLEGGLPNIIRNLPAALNYPFDISLCEDSLKAVLILVVAYVVGLGVYLSTARNYRRNEEHGSARWGNVREIIKRYRNPKTSQNKLLTQNAAIGLDGRAHRRNLNVLVVGGSGAGKTRFYAKPNIMQANTSFVILDPKGEILRDTGTLLESEGYRIRVLDLIDMEKSDSYNPFMYLRDDNDVQKLVTNLFKNTAPKNAQSQDPFWGATRSQTAVIQYKNYCV